MQWSPAGHFSQPLILVSAATTASMLDRSSIDTQNSSIIAGEL
jgi:hypothetical protein